MANDKSYEPFRQQAQDFMCKILPNSPSSTTQYTKGIVRPCFFSFSSIYVLSKIMMFKKMSEKMVAYFGKWKEKINYKKFVMP